MAYSKDFYTAVNTTPLTDATTSAAFGTAIAQYEIRKCRNVTNLGSTLGYLLTVRHRIMVPNATAYSPGLNKASGYSGYPAILVNNIAVSVTSPGSTTCNIHLHNMFPKTLNSSVNTASSSGQGTNRANSYQHSSGSSSTNINTFGVEVSGGFFGDAPVGSLSLDYSHSWEKSRYHSSSTGGEAGSRSSSGDSVSMSVKDWDSYGYLDSAAISPTWVWGQGYPWDVIQYNQSTDTQTIVLPKFVQDRLYDGALVLPPSQLSLFGLDFTMQATWLVHFPGGVTGDETITVTHDVSSYTASHTLSGTAIVATLQSSTEAYAMSYSSAALDFSTYALDPIVPLKEGTTAAVGFTAHPFLYPPTGAASTFKIVSPDNNLQVAGTGFDGIMTASFSAPKSPPSLTINFKIADAVTDYSILFMHWIGKSSGACKLTCTINQNWVVVLHVDTAEGQGGRNNVATIDLRNMDFTSINLHDYLVVGNNVITVDIAPVDAAVSNEYTLFAMAIE